MTVKSDLKKRIRARQARTGESYTAARAHVLRARNGESESQTDSPERVAAIVLKCNEASLRIQVPGESGSFTLRCSGYDAHLIAPGQFVELTVSKRWTWRGDVYVTGTIEQVWTNVPALALTPLPLSEHGEHDPREGADEVEDEGPFADMWAELSSGPKTEYEFHEIAWGGGVGVDPADKLACLVSDAAEIVPHDPAGARALLMDALVADLRCIDAHVHLGNMVFERSAERALIHYEIALGIGELSLGPDFDGCLPWGWLFNRPFLRALHGFGLCMWRMGQPDRAREAFERMMRLNLDDNQGVRFCLADLYRGRSWEQSRGGELPGGAVVH